MIRKSSHQTQRAAVRVYSYVRFSTPEQRLGDSERRQIDGAKAWAKRNGYELDESLRLLDDGRSGFHGTHRTKGKLGAFLQLVEAGDIPSGSILVVENIDRLSREGIETTLKKIIFQLFEHGITLVTLSPEETYEPGCTNHPKFLALFIFMGRAHDESRIKSERISAARARERQRARESRRVSTRMCPAWLTPKADRTGFDIIEPAAEAIRMIFQFKLDGVGTHSIAARLNAEAPWHPPTRPRAQKIGDGWRSSYVKKILWNPAVIGEYQPCRKVDGKRIPDGEPISKYFPTIVKPTVFHAVQAKLQENKGKGGRTGVASNLFAHIVKCAYCGGSMAFIDKGKPPKGSKYLVCDRARRKMSSCSCRERIRYEEFQQAVLDNCHKLRPADVLPKPDAQAQRCRRLREKLSGEVNSLISIDEQLHNLTDQVAKSKEQSARDRYEARIVQLEHEKSKLAAVIANDERELAKASCAAESVTKWRKGIAELRTALTSENVSIRLKLRAQLRELIDRIDVYTVGRPIEFDGAVHEGSDGPRVETIAEKIAALVDDTNSKLARSKLFQDFLRHVVRRRMSKEGRFYRIYFKTGLAISVVPAGSLADGATISDKRWMAIQPNIAKLWSAFRETRNLEIEA
jgi:DNA invertase Pin-like site-specific DNA recombinase